MRTSCPPGPHAQGGLTGKHPLAAQRASMQSVPWVITSRHVIVFCLSNIT